MNQLDYENLGYTVAPKLFDPAELDLLVEEAESLFKGNLFSSFLNDKDLYVNTCKAVQTLPSLYRLSISYLLLMHIKELGVKFPTLCTKPLLFSHNKNLAISDVYYKTPPHRDGLSMHCSINGVIVWIPLKSIDKDMGRLQIIPKSHKEKVNFAGWYHDFAVEQADNDKFIDVDIDPGDVLFFSPWLVHRSGNNTTEEKIRWVANFRYSDALDEEWIQRKRVTPYTYKLWDKPPFIPEHLK